MLRDVRSYDTLKICLMCTLIKVPQFAGLVHAACGNERAIPIELSAANLCGVARERVNPLAGLHIPYCNCVVETSRHDVSSGCVKR